MLVDNGPGHDSADIEVDLGGCEKSNASIRLLAHASLVESDGRP